MKTKTAKRRKPCWIYVPESFDPKEHLPPELQKHADSARYLLHRIIRGSIDKKQDLDGFVPLKFEYLRTVIPDRVIKPLREALEPDVIECDGRYIEGFKAFGFKLSDRFRHDRIVQAEITDPVTVEKIIRVRRADERKIRLDVHKWLRSKFKDLEVDLPKAISILSSHHDFELVKIPAVEIATKESQFSVCRYGRFHTPLTRLAKQVRCCLHVGGEPLVNLDIANSQPLFLGLLVLNYRKQRNKTFGFQTFKENVVDPYRDIDAIIEKTVTPFTFNKEYYSTYRSLPAITNRIAIEKESETQYLQALPTTIDCPQETPLIKNHLQQDEQLYLKLCQEGQLYKYLAELVDPVNRPWIKKDLFGVLFSQKSFQSPLKTAFNREFPNVAEVIREHKKKDYQFLARLLQLYESNLMINHVVRRAMNEIPEAPVFTIHDSIMTTEPYVDQIIQIMEAEFASLGLSPFIRQERCHGQQDKPPESLTGALVMGG